MKVKFGQTLGYVYYEAVQIKASECISLCRNEFKDIVPHEKEGGYFMSISLVI